MRRGKQKTEALGRFIIYLKSLGISANPLGERPCIFEINGKIINIRSYQSLRRTPYNTQKYSQDIAVSVLKYCSHIIYLTNDINYLYLIPSSFIENNLESLWPLRGDSNSLSRKFCIDYPEHKISTSIEKDISIKNYYIDLKEDLEKFKTTIAK